MRIDNLIGLMTYQIIYSKRKTVALTISRQGEVVVRAPKRVSKRFIEDFVFQQRDWIDRSLRKVLSRPKKQFTEGEMFLFLGREYPLHIIYGYHRNKAELLEEKLRLYLIITAPDAHLGEQTANAAQVAIRHWYKLQAQQIIAHRCQILAQLMGVNYRRISLRDTHTRWGSCSGLGNLNFCYRLVMAPLVVIDYVVIHELAHLKYHNHSKDFWNFVVSVCPDYTLHKK